MGKVTVIDLPEWITDGSSDIPQCITVSVQTNRRF